MHAAEGGFWWYAGLRSMIAGQLRAVTPGLRPTSEILDAGCGTGGNLRLLRRLLPKARLTGLDVSPVALDRLGANDCDAKLCADLNAQPAFEHPFDLILACDVLSHQGMRWEAALDYFRGLLRPGGTLLLNLPAFPWLAGRHDRAVKVTKRFRPAELRLALAQAGFADIELRFWNAALLPLAFVARRWSRRAMADEAPVSQLTDGSDGWNPLLTRWIEWETRLACRWHLPFGTSLFVRARKPVAA